MALAIPLIKTELKTQFDATYGAPSGAGPTAEQDKFLTAMATAVFNILTTQATTTTTIVSGSSAGVYPGTIL